MTPSIPLLLTFCLLGLAICAVWMQPVRLPGKVKLAPWMLLFLAAIASAYAHRFIGSSGVLALAVFSALAWASTASRIGRRWRILCAVLTGLLALALAIHKIPGFHNPQLISGVRFSPDAVPFSQYANFDKGAVGLILLAFLCHRCGAAGEWRAMARRAAPIALATVAGVMGCALLMGVVAPDLKWPAYTPVFLAINLLFTCVAEEAFFRGFLQDRLSTAVPRGKAWQAGVVLLSGLLFGLVHLGGGVVYAALATLAGIGYAWVYAATRKIEAAVLTHFAVNAVHFIGFSYPALQAAR